MRRTQFVVGGKHPLLELVRDSLVRSGYALTPIDQVDAGLPVLLVWGGADSAVPNTPWPTLLLSAASVYSDRDHKLRVREVGTMDEAQGHVITSPLDPTAGESLTFLLSEHQLVCRPVGRTMIVRPFNVYGPNVRSGTIHHWVQEAKQGTPLTVFTPGRQLRTFLYEDDFLTCVGLLVSRLLNGGRGIYNVGSSTPVEIISAARSVGHAFGTNDVVLVDPTCRYAWWRIPAVHRVRACTKWQAKVSLRSGLFRMSGKT